MTYLYHLQLIGGFLIAVGLYALVDQWQSGARVRVNDVADVLFNMGLIIAILGAIIFFVSFAGCIGALRENTALLKLVTTDENINRVLVFSSIVLTTLCLFNSVTVLNSTFDFLHGGADHRDFMFHLSG